MKGTRRTPPISPPAWRFPTLAPSPSATRDAELRRNPIPLGRGGQRGLLCRCASTRVLLGVRQRGSPLFPSLCARSHVGGLAPEAAVRRGPDGEGPGDHRLGQLWVSNLEGALRDPSSLQGHRPPGPLGQNAQCVSCNSRACLLPSHKSCDSIFAK